MAGSSPAPFKAQAALSASVYLILSTCVFSVHSTKSMETRVTAAGMHTVEDLEQWFLGGWARVLTPMTSRGQRIRVWWTVGHQPEA